MLADLAKVSIGKHIKDSGYDAVRWTAKGSKGTEWGKWHSTACYAPITGRLEDVEVHNKAWAVQEQMPSLIYLCFFRRLQKEGLVPKEAHALVVKGENQLIIPRNGYDRHSVFTSLCLFRHMDRQTRKMVVAWKLWEKLRHQGTTFLQCFHYALGKMGASGHSCWMMGPYHGNQGPVNPAMGYAMAKFGSLSYPERKELPVKTVTHTMYSYLAAQINPVTSKLPGNQTNGIGTPKYSFPKPEYVLHPQYAPLYKADLTPEEFAEAMEAPKPEE